MPGISGNYLKRKKVQKMSVWQKVVTGAKFFFGGFDSAIDYLLNTVLNPYLSTDAVSGKVKTAYETSNMVLGYLRKYANYCPSKWRGEYDAVIVAVDTMVGVFADGQVTRDEITACVDAFQTARAAWNAD